MAQLVKSDDYWWSTPLNIRVLTEVSPEVLKDRLTVSSQEVVKELEQRKTVP